MMQNVYLLRSECKLHIRFSIIKLTLSLIFAALVLSQQQIIVYIFHERLNR